MRRAQEIDTMITIFQYRKEFEENRIDELELGYKP